MTRRNGWKTGCALLALCAVTTIAAQAQVFNTLAWFHDSDGAGPE
jgi:hypothetical protein